MSRMENGDFIGTLKSAMSEMVEMGRYKGTPIDGIILVGTLVCFINS